MSKHASALQDSEDESYDADGLIWNRSRSLTYRKVWSHSRDPGRNDQAPQIALTFGKESPPEP